MQTVSDHIRSNGLKKQWVAKQLGLTYQGLYKALNNPNQLKRDKLKVEKLCQLFNCTPDDIDFDNV